LKILTIKTALAKRSTADSRRSVDVCVCWPSSRERAKLCWRTVFLNVSTQYSFAFTGCLIALIMFQAILSTRKKDSHLGAGKLHFASFHENRKVSLFVMIYCSHIVRTSGA